jgi:hypothetical protein
MIDNMLIVSPPQEKITNEQTQASQKADYLDFNDLDVDLLNEDFLDTEEDLDFTELDVDYLDVNFLEDLLDVLDDLDEQEEEDQLVAVDGTNIVGTRIGQDGETQITTILQGDKIKLIRSVNQNAQVVVNGDGSYTVIFIQDGVSNTVKINGGTSSSITIIQTP